MIHQFLYMLFPLQVYDREFPEDVENSIFCKTVSSHVPEPFKEVFVNKYYRILLVA